MFKVILEAISGLLVPPEYDIKSARDWPNQPPYMECYLVVLCAMEDANFPVTIPLRIVGAWQCKEEKDVYIEVILPKDEEVSPEIPVMGKTDTVGKKYKLTGFFTPFKYYIKLLELQKDQLDPRYQGLNDANQCLISRMDKDHALFYTKNMPPEQRAELREIYLRNGLLLDSEYPSNEKLMEAIWQHKKENAGA